MDTIQDMAIQLVIHIGAMQATTVWLSDIPPSAPQQDVMLP